MLSRSSGRWVAFHSTLRGLNMLVPSKALNHHRRLPVYIEFRIPTRILKLDTYLTLHYRPVNELWTFYATPSDLNTSKYSAAAG